MQYVEEAPTDDMEDRRRQLRLWARQAIDAAIASMEFLPPASTEVCAYIGQYLWSADSEQLLAAVVRPYSAHNLSCAFAHGYQDWQTEYSHSTDYDQLLDVVSAKLVPDEGVAYDDPDAGSG